MTEKIELEAIEYIEPEAEAISQEEFEAGAEVVEDTTDRVSKRKNFSPGLLGEIFERKTRTGGGALSGGSPIKQHELTFELDGATCSKDFFVDDEGEYYDVQITMRALSSAQEINAMANVTDPAQTPFVLGKACLYKLNGTVIKDDIQKDFLWEGLGMGGRQLCLFGYNKLGSASEAALGKFQKSFTVG